MKKKLLFTTIAILTLAALFLRFYRFEAFVMFLSDQGRDARIVRDIVTLKNLPLIGAPSSVGQVYLGPFYYYLVAPFLLLSNFNPAGLAFGVSLIAILSTAWFYIIIRKQFGEQTGILFLITSSFSATLIEFSRFSWNPNLLPYFGFATLYFFHRWLEKPTWKKGVLFGSTLGLSLQLHYLAALIVLPMLVLYLYKVINSSGNHFSLKNIMVPLLSFLSAISPLILFDLKHDFLNSRQFIKLFTEGGLSSSSSSYGSRVMETIGGLVSHGLGLPDSHFYSFLILSGILILGVLIAKKRKSTFILLHILTIICYIFGFAYLGSPRFAHYYGPIYLSLFIVIAILPGYFKSPWNRISAAIVAASFVLMQISGYYFFFQQPNDQIGHARRIADFMATKIGDSPTNIATWPVNFGEESYVYFLETDGVSVVDKAKLEISDQLFVICGEDPCQVLNSPSWNISMFGPAQISDSWEIEGLKIIKLDHKNPSSQP